MTTVPSNWRQRFFSAIARLDEQRPWTVLGIALALAIISILYTKARLEFRTGQDDLVHADNRDSRNYLRFTKEFPDLDALIIVVSVEPSLPDAEHYVDQLADRLNRDKTNVKSVFYQIDPKMMGNRGLLYLGLDDLQALAAKVGASTPLLAGYAGQPTLANLFGMTNKMFDAAAAQAMQNQSSATASGDPMAQLSMLDPLLTGMLGQGTTFNSPFAALMPRDERNGAMRDNYLTSSNGRYLLLHVAPGDGVADGPDPVDVIQGDLNAVRKQFPHVFAGMTGGPALSHAEESTTQHDMMQGSVIGVIGMLLLLVIPFRGIVEPFFAVVALLIGCAWSFGYTTLAVGHLNLLSAVFTSVLVGIGINFPIHLMARYDEARRKGHPMPAALELAVVNTGTGVFASACIMALAFLMPKFTDFVGIAELGEISAAGLFLCLISALLVFPALIALRDRRASRRQPPALSLAPRKSTLEKLFAWPGLIAGVLTIGTVAAGPLIAKVRFDQNVLKLQANDAEAVRFENILLHDSGRSSWFAVSFAPTRSGADRKAAAFKRLPEVTDVETIGTYIPDHQAEKLALLARLKVGLDPIQIRPAASPSNSQELQQELGGLSARLAAVEEHSPTDSVAKTRALVDQALAKLGANPHAFDTYEQQLAGGLGEQLGMLKEQLAPDEVTDKNLPKIIRDRFIGASGSYLVQIYPKGDVWEDASLKRFIDALRTVDRDVTGPPVQTYVLANVMRHGYERAAVLALIAVFVFVFADFRNFRDALLATVPLVYGGAWLLEAMGILGWEFNLANLFAVPIIIGMGVDNGVNMIYRWREETDKSSLILTKAVGKSVTICSLTTIAAFAALIPADHHGISSLGWVMTVGVSFILAATFLVLPALFEILGTRIEHAREHHEPAPENSAPSAQGRPADDPPRAAGGGTN
ncbi:MAG TPA: MMPL family transporter [Candidatus Binataceae bacterium]|nr:MMPL family transporter [Candidatus Binataceae bacterium]